MEPSASLAALVSALPVGLLVETPQRRVQVANQAFCDIFALPVAPAQLIGADCAAAAESVADQFADPAGFLSGIESILAARENVHGEELAMGDGRVLERDFLFEDLGQGAEQIVWMYKDITALATARRRATAARDQAVTLAQQRSTMLATVTHEVRTPLVGLVGLTEALEAAPLPSWAHDAISAIRGSADSLTQLLEDLLDLGRLDVDPRALRAVPFDLDELLAEAAETVGVSARRSGVLLTSRTTPRVPSPVMGDAPRLRQVVLNLLTNAVKFAAGGEVFVVADADGDRLQVAVVDDGPGIDPAVAGRIFESFVQGEVADDDTPRGAGLGLAITAQIVERMGGHITVEEPPRGGTQFVVTLPLVLPRVGNTAAAVPRDLALAGVRLALIAPTSAVWAALAHALESRGARLDDDPSAAVDAVVVVGDANDPEVRDVVTTSLTRSPSARHVVLTRRPAPRDAIAGAVTLGLPPHPQRLLAAIKGADERLVTRVAESLGTPAARVLVAEDDEATRTLVTAMLTQMGASVQAVSDGRSAVTAAVTDAPDLVLLDLRLPVLSGIDALAEIRSAERGRDLRLVVVSASASDAARSEALAAGADAYLAKPVSKDQLHELLVSLVPGAATPDRSASSTHPAPESQSPAQAAVEVERLQQLEDEMGEEDIVREVVGVFLDELDDRLSAIAGTAAGDDLDAAHTSAHALGSPALMLGAVRLGRRCRQLEATSDMDQFLAIASLLAADAAVTRAELRSYLDGSSSKG